MKARELKELGTAELDQRIRETAQELCGLRLKRGVGAGLENPLRLRTLRREVARMLTVKREREAGT